MSKVWTDRAIVLKRRSFGEADRLVTIFTRRHGKLVVWAKGVRGARSKRRAHVELFNAIRAQVVSTRGGQGILILAQTELVVDRSSLKSDLKLLRIAYHLVELVDRLTPDREKNWELFGLLDRALSSVDLGTWADEVRLTQAFEEKLLRLLGYGVPEHSRGELVEYIEGIVERKLVSRRVLS